MKIAIIQTNPTIGNFQANIDKMSLWVTKAAENGCELAIFPELSISGYPPQDLLERQSFLNDQQRAFDSLRQKCEIPILCGLITRHTARTGKALHNSAALFDRQECRMVHKRLLPSYDVFDETRYFEPGQESMVLPFKGLNLGVTICEDILNDPSLMGSLLDGNGGNRNQPQQLYRHDPIADLLTDPENSVDLLINIAASPFHLGKSAAKLVFFSKLAQKTGLPILYVNQVGGQDSLLFDGQSLVIAPDGQLLARGACFSEDMLIIDTNNLKKGGTRIPQEKEADGPASTTFEALVMGTRDYVKKCGFSKAVIGLSGGVDSALTAAIACEALGSKNVFGVALPSPYSSEESVEDARNLADNLDIKFEIIPIDNIFQTHLQTLEPIFAGKPEDTTEQNIQARIRGNLLMALANKFGYLLLSTGNKSEMAVGYCTLYGDMSGGLAVISDVPKMLVYRICKYLNRKREIIPPRTISKPPSAELAPHQKDQDDLPPYEILDPILQAYLEDQLSIDEIVQQGFDEELVKDVVRRVTINEHKRKQAPMGLKVTSKAFGYGRRYPTTQQYKEEPEN